MTSDQSQNPFQDPPGQPSSRDDPFRDPQQPPGLFLLEPRPLPDVFTSDIPAMLKVGIDTTLTIEGDSLLILDGALTDDDSAKCCGLVPCKSKATLAIPLYNVLWAELTGHEITVQYARTESSDVLRPAYINYAVNKSSCDDAQSWVQQLLDRAYGKAQKQKRIKVLVNPFGGKGNAQRLYIKEIEPIFAAARCTLDVEQTNFQGQAVDLAEKLDVGEWDVVACCSGDGIPHEVFNGLGKKNNAAKALQKLAVVQLPCGSGNAMSLNLNGTNSCSAAALAVVKGLRTPLDLVSITQGDRRYLSFLSQSVGIVAESDLATDNIRWMGPARFTVGFLLRLINKTVYPCDLAVGVEIEDKASIKQAYAHEAAKPPNDGTEDRSPIRSSDPDNTGLPTLRFGTVKDALPEEWTLNPYDNMGNFYAGNMAYMSPDANFFQAALPSDGCLDLVCIDGDIPRSKAFNTMLAVESMTFFDLPHVIYRKISGYRIVPRDQKYGYISIDGERVPFEPFQAEVHRGLGTVLSKTGHLYEAKGPA
ncbi:ATP-NAD kinase-like domain-containing protein [Phyllosticta citrichinensis]